ncbi:hypothetical protein [uncultured Sphingomonas sp.]|uniref:hypothetical protein n=1 Tax=uncultured Sphingomonas sp. TaxID=158754 RepID=UPI00260EF149|nr:hypothetical protein [uncultured Sphingomonas sp.]
MLERHTQASFDTMILRLALEGEIPDGTGLSVPKKLGMVARAVLARPDHVVHTLDGSATLAEALVREAVALVRPHFTWPQQTALLRGLARDGYVLEEDEDTHAIRLRAALPEKIALPETDDEVRGLLRQLGFQISAGHLDQAIEAHTRGDWAAANAQLRTFFESLFDAIAFAVDHATASGCATSESRRAMLAGKRFLATDRNEWTQDGKNFINGLFKMLHTDGSHPGLSDEDHSTFRLHLVLVSARAFLRRLTYGQ